MCLIPNSGVGSLICIFLKSQQRIRMKVTFITAQKPPTAFSPAAPAVAVLLLYWSKRLAEGCVVGVPLTH